MSTGQWQLYDALIDGISDSLTVEDYLIGCAWTMVKAGGRTGVALTVKGRVREPVYGGPVVGDSLKTVAGCVKSWNFTEASLGMAAINCFYNTPEKVRALGGFDGLEKSLENNTDRDAFQLLAKEASGKRVAVIGRFPHLESQLAPVCALSVLEREPDLGDFPDSACEYLLPDQELVFITGMTLINKTLPRLLQLVRPNARAVMVGPSVPLTPLLYRYGATDLDGFCVTNPKLAEALVKGGGQKGIFACGAMVGLSRWNIGPENPVKRAGEPGPYKRN
jgi:uncharacterized protein (DUF4213/DUF364 family)